MINKVTRYVCSECHKEYKENPSTCSCALSNKPGKVVGPFKLLSSENGGWKCECIFCTQVKFVHSSNLKRQTSCGCVPRSIRIQTFDQYSVTFACTKCREIQTTTLPVLEWCCDA